MVFEENLFLMEELKIAVVSDLHCNHSRSEGGIDTWLLSDNMRRPVHQHPVQSLIDLIKKDELKVDLLICPGDISNRTDPQGLITGWSFLEELKVSFYASHLIATLGNHDVDSRGIHNKYDFLNMPRNLKDNFPFEFPLERKSFIADSFCIIDLGEILIFNFNSVHSHTNKLSAEESIISDDILENIKNELGYIKKEYKYKIAITHHHPIKHSNVGFKYKDKDSIEKGDKLIDILIEFNFQIFIHGHKHEPKLTIYNGLPIFASGSISSHMNIMETNSKNNFHIVELAPSESRGIIRSWDYTYGVGWSPSTSKIKSEIGFGAKAGVKDYSKMILDHFIFHKLERMNNVDFIETFPDFKFFPPIDKDKLFIELQANFEIVQEYSSGLIKEIIKTT